MNIDRCRAAFADAEVEARFNRHVLPEQNARLRGSLVFAALFYVAFGITDFATLGASLTAWVLLALRIAVALVAAVGYVATRRHPGSVAVARAVASALLSAALGVFMIVAWCQPEALAWNTMSQALILMAVYVTFPNRFGYAIAIGVGSSVVFALMLLVQGGMKPDDVLTLVCLLILGNALGYVAARRDHLAQREVFRSSLMLQELAERDPLTGCYNRRVLQGGLPEAELARTHRYGTALSVILCDIDHFKRINDGHGHAAGDLVLQHFAGLLQQMTRAAVDTVIRFGGEEFLLVLPQTELAGAEALAERMRQAFAASAIEVGEQAAVAVTASFGVACVPAGHRAPPAHIDALIGAADAQLYAVKRNGRNGVRATVVSAVTELQRSRA